MTDRRPVSERAWPSWLAVGIERFWSRVTIGGECWHWSGKLLGNYGWIRTDRAKGADRGAFAHRVSYQIHHGPIPGGLLVCHKCDNPPCVRPDHLFLGTQADNMDDMYSKGRRQPGRIRRGEAHSLSKLTSDAVRIIRSSHVDGETVTVLARRFGVSRALVRGVINHRRWAHVTDTIAPPNAPNAGRVA